jgi:hypothetical protein
MTKRETDRQLKRFSEDLTVVAILEGDTEKSKLYSFGAAALNSLLRMRRRTELAQATLYALDYAGNVLKRKPK